MWLIVDFDKKTISDYFVNFFDFKYSMEDVFGKEVDLMENQLIRNSYFKKT
jgi:predicted nucleotidyltransferase